MAYRVGIIGCGRMAGTIDDEITWEHPDFQLPYGHANGYIAVPEAELVAAADIDADTLQSFSDRFGIPNRYTDYREMVEKEDLDIVSVTVRALDRCDPIVYAAENGVRGIYSEKALCCSLKELGQITTALRANGTHLAYGPMRRYWSGFQAARRVIQSGDLGRPTAVLVPRMTLLHSGSHIVDVGMYLLGDPEIRYVQADLAETEVVSGMDEGYKIESDPSIEYAIAGFANDARLIFTDLHQGEVKIQCENGIIQSLGDSAVYTIWRRGDSRYDWKQVPFPPWEGRSGTIAIIEDLIHSIETGEPGLSNLDVAARGMELCLGFTESHRLGGKRIEFPLEDSGIWVHSR